MNASSGSGVRSEQRPGFRCQERTKTRFQVSGKNRDQVSGVLPEAYLETAFLKHGA
jgi:hypothetical protein